MILVLLVVFTLMVFGSWLLIKGQTMRRIAGTVSSLLLVATIVLVALHLYNHLGMEKVTTTTENEIYTAGDTASPANLLIVSEIGTASDNYAMVYRDSADAEASETHFVPDESDIVNAVKLTASYQTADTTEAVAETKTTKWDFSSNFYKTLFSFENQADEIIAEKVTVTVPEKTWVVLTSDQAQQLQDSQSSLTPEEQSAAQANLQAAVQTAVSNYLLENPSASQEDIQNFTTETTAEVAVQAIKAQLANA
ncbi:DUF4811 domain-containing protein [Enterococcus sp. LJL120]